MIVRVVVNEGEHTTLHEVLAPDDDPIQKTMHRLLGTVFMTREGQMINGRFVVRVFEWKKTGEG